MMSRPTNPYKKESNTYCDVCRVWISNHAQAIRNHENGSGHKEKMQQKLQNMRRNAQQEERQLEEARRALGGIEAAARRAYADDVAAAVRPEDQLGPAPPGAHVLGPGARARLAEEAERRALEQTVDAALKAREEAAYRQAAAAREAARGGPGGVRAPPAWVFDTASGFHRDAASGFLYDPASKQYYNPAAGAWGAVGPDAEEEEEEEYPLNPFTTAAQPPPPPGRPNLPPALSLSALPRAAPPPPGAAAHLAPPPAHLAPPPAHLAPRHVAPGGAAQPGSTSAFLLGFGTNHPKFEAARAKTDAARARVEAATGARSIAVSGGPRGLGTTVARPQNAGAAAAAAAIAAGAKRKGADDPKAKAEAEALARREAARKRVEARTIGQFGLN